MVMTLSHVGRGRGEGQEPGAKPGGQRYKENDKMVGLYKQEQPSPLGWGVEWGTPARRAPETGRVQGCRESLAARSSLMC